MLVISRVIIRVTPFRALITLLIIYLLSPLPLQVNPKPYPQSLASGWCFRGITMLRASEE